MFIGLTVDLFWKVPVESVEGCDRPNRCRPGADSEILGVAGAGLKKQKTTPRRELLTHFTGSKSGLDGVRDEGRERGGIGAKTEFLE
jgi:hypothetical protein